MNRSTKTWMALSLTLGFTGAASAQLGFDGLAGGPAPRIRIPSNQLVLPPEPVAPRPVPQPQGRLNLDALPNSQNWFKAATELNRADALLEAAMRDYRVVVMEAAVQTDVGTNKYYFDDLARYNAAVAAADRLSENLKKAHRALEVADRHVDEMEENEDPSFALIARSEYTRGVTIYDQVHDWTAKRHLKFNGPGWGDSQNRPMMTAQWDAGKLALPTSPGVRSRVVLTPDQTDGAVAHYIQDMDRQLEVARGAQQRLESSRTKPASSEEEVRSMGNWIYYQYKTEVTFDSVAKPAALDFALAMLRAKAGLNAAILAAEAPTEDKFSDRSHMAVRTGMLRFARLVWWGDYRFLQVEGTFGSKRKLYIFDGGDFRNQYRIRTGGIESKHFDDVLDYAEYQGRNSSLD